MPRKPATTLPAFTPVPRLKDRSNGWKPEVQHAFLEALAETGSVQSACRRVGRTVTGAYQLRRHPEGHEFRKAWLAAQDIGMQRLEDVAMDRALNGVEVPVYSYGKLVGTRRRYNDRLLMFMLRNRAARRFTEGGARGLSAVDKDMLKRLKKQWRREWAAESLAARPDMEEVRAEIHRKVEAIRAAERRRWTPRECELEAALAEERASRRAREEAEAAARMQQWQRPAPDQPALLDPPPDADDR